MLTVARDPHNTRERITNALDSLVGAGPILDRLPTAALTLSPLRTRDIPAGPAREL
jgi:hypothetical protein